MNKYDYPKSPPYSHLLSQIADDNVNKKREREEQERIKTMSLMREHYLSKIAPEMRRVAENGERAFNISCRQWDKRESLKELLKNDGFKFRMTTYGISVTW